MHVRGFPDLCSAGAAALRIGIYAAVLVGGCDDGVIAPGYSRDGALADAAANDASATSDASDASQALDAPATFDAADALEAADALDPADALDASDALDPSDAPSPPDDGAIDGAVDQPTVVMACPPPVTTVCPGPVPSFAATIVPILDASCNTCHDPNVPAGPWPLHDYGDVVAWRSSIIPVLLDCSMPPADGGVAISETDRQQILTWIVCGTPDN